MCVLGFTCVSAERVAEGMDVKNCALSLVCVILYLCVCLCVCVLGFTCVSAERVAEGMDVKHCALSLVCV